MAPLCAEYIAAGANRHPSAADWWGEILAFGTGCNVGVWDLGDQEGKELVIKGNGRGISNLLIGHTGSVNAVKFFPTAVGLFLLTGSVDKTVRVWQEQNLLNISTAFKCLQVLDHHQASINSIAVTPEAEIFATGDAAATVKIWKVSYSETGATVSIQQSIQIIPRFFPLALALQPLHQSNTFVLAVAGTATSVQLYIADSTEGFKLKATLSGHEGWVRSLSFTYETSSPFSDLLLASASQDKYIRLWRICQGKELPAAAVVAGSDPALGAFLPGKPLSNKAHRFVAGGQDYSATFEALLLGHEDWIYTAIWRPGGKTLQLLSASADNSLTIWQQDSTTGVWVSIARLGEISGQKGSTTATGSTGGFWTGLWSPSGTTVACIGRTGSFRIWYYKTDNERWIQGIAISGHTAPITGIAWSRSGSYILSTSSDQTTRLHAQWKSDTYTTWHEIARPQIHGYDISCIDTLNETSFVSGAEEKLLRVFNMPKVVADTLQKLGSATSFNSSSLPESASMPVLGLSNKKITETYLQETTEDSNPQYTTASLALEVTHTLQEDHLSKGTLFPETEKLYGHGYEISCLAAALDGSVLATACRATSLEHAVIRLYDTTSWQEVKPPLMAHSLTATGLQFEKQGYGEKAGPGWLLSVGRDRMWAVWRKDIVLEAESAGHGRNEGDGVDKDVNKPSPHRRWALVQSNPKGHTRMILDAGWAPGRRRAFVTAGRDKTVKFWAWEEGLGDKIGDKGIKIDKALGGSFVLKSTITEDAPVTAIDFSEAVQVDGEDECSERAFLAIGLETGRFLVYRILLEGMVVMKKFVIDQSSCPSRVITQLAWRPQPPSARDSKRGEVGIEEFDNDLAVASEDFSLRIYSLKAILSASVSSSS